MNQKGIKWTRVPMYCPKCGTLNDGYQDEEGKLRYECKRCKVTMVRSYKNRRSEVLEVKLPKEKSKFRASLEYRNKNQQLNNIAMNDIVDAWLKQC